MENLNAEQVKNEIQSLIKALKDCGGWVKRGNGEGWFNHEILADALALINQLTEENERLRAENETLKIATNDQYAHLCDCHDNIAEMLREKEADTVREMLQRIKDDAASISLLSNPPKFMLEIREDALDQIAKELEGE